MAALTFQERRKLSALMKSGFEDYAKAYGDRRHVGAVTDSPEKNTALIRSYGAEFVRILDGQTGWQEDLPPLREDLFNLIEKGCPKLDIIEFLFACTRGRTLAVSDTLKSIGLGGPSLQLLSQLCELVSERIAALDMPNPDGPVSLLPQLVPEMPDDENRARLVNDLHKLPQLLGLYGDLLRLYPPKTGSHHPKFEPIFKDLELVLFYELLRHFGLGYPTLSRLLRAMRDVRCTVNPKAKYVRPFAPVRTRGKKVPVRDPLGESALQRRLLRFSKDKNNLDSHMLIVWSVMRYLSDEWSTQRAGGEILFDLLPQLMRPQKVTIPVIVTSEPLSTATPSSAKKTLTPKTQPREMLLQFTWPL
jgi:hypothetical protein